jgi:glycosyltransferase involved in cell wall biosynthesis
MVKPPPKVSIVVPVYNVEKYLRQCLESIVGQTLREIEIIVVNDGSTDGSRRIIREYAERDGRIVVIDKPNEGYGKTMNRGLDAATGKYVGIVESDDWIEPDMYETLCDLAERHDAEVARCRHLPFKDDTGKDKPAANMPEREAGRVISPRRNPAVFYCLRAGIWCAIYPRDFLEKYRIRFLESPGASFQDNGFNFKVWAMAQRVYLTMQPLLHYRVHGAQSVKSRDKIFCVCDEFDEIDRFLRDYPQLDAALEKIKNRVKYEAYLWNYKRLDGASREVFRERLAA